MENNTYADDYGCQIKSLPARLHATAAEVATRINPVNSPLREIRHAGDALRPDHLVVTTTKYWGPAPRRFPVSFMESTPADLRDRILSHMNAWSATSGMSFAYTAGVGEVRISREPGGYWSYLGTDIHLIPPGRPTMNLEAFSMGTEESEYRRVVRHETGHTLGFPHEHLRRELVGRIDPDKAYPYYLATQGWSPEMVDQQVLTPLDEASIFGTPVDVDCIMCYHVPGSITFDGQPIRGGLDISPSDFAFAALIYPKLFGATAAPPQVAADDWDASEDVALTV